MEADFGGYTTKYDVLCADGRRIKRKAFDSQNGTKVPLVWQHQRRDPENVIGHVYLEKRDDGIYGYGKFNDSEKAQHCKMLVEHGDIFSMSIFANDLVQKGADVTHGKIREVSLVYAPANPGALIDSPVIQHGDNEYEDITKAFITSGEDFEFCETTTIQHSADIGKPDNAGDDNASAGDQEEDLEGMDDEEIVQHAEEIYNSMTADQKKVVDLIVGSAIGELDPDAIEHANDEDNSDEDETVEDVYKSMTKKQQQVVAYIVGVALANAGVTEGSDEDVKHSNIEMEGEGTMEHRNVFDQNESNRPVSTAKTLTHDELSCIFDDAQQCGSLKKSFLKHAAAYGIENIDVLFSDAKTVGDNPHMIKRNTEWVEVFLGETTHVPFSRIKSVAADLTADEARAKGYTKGNLKKEEVIKLLKRVTTPTTVYKKQKLDRDDVNDITELNIIAWIKAELKIMLNEEVARAGLLSDGREIDDADKINEENIRPIWKDNDMYAHHVILPANTSIEDLPEELLRAQESYKGSGNPSMFTTSGLILKMLLIKDKIGRRLYNTDNELSSAMGVSKLVKVPVMDRQIRTTEDGKTVQLLAIIVNPRDYTYGAESGGEVSMFDDFDIDYNQYKYLLETRCCGCLTVPKSAIVVEQEVGGSAATTAEIG